jgi:hypothetical protein
MPTLALVVIPGEASHAYAAGNAGVDNDTFSDLEALDTFTQGGNFACGIGAEDVRELEFQSWPTIPGPEIGGVQRDPLNADLDMAGLQPGRGEITKREDFRSPVFLDVYGLQRIISSERELKRVRILGCLRRRSQRL